MSIPEDKQRNHLIDLLRFLAAAWVALFHFNLYVFSIDNWYRDFCGLGHWGVPVFFIISGYCIGITERHVKTPKEFLIKRFFRIYPPYLFSLLAVCFCVLAIKLIVGTNNTSTGMPKTPGGIMATLFLFTQPVSAYKPVNWVYWTLPYEVFFYLLIFLNLTVAKQTKIYNLLLLAIVSILLPLQKQGFLFFFDELPTFLIGYALYLIISKPENLYLSILLLALSVAGLSVKHQGYAYLIIAFVISLLILINSRTPLSKNALSKLGDYSYAIYLIHVPVGIYLFEYVKKNARVFQDNIALNMLFDFTLLGIIIFLSKIMYDKIELPSIRLGKRFSR